VPDLLIRAREAHPLLWVWATTTAVIFGLCLVWSLATPIGATNDEGAQVIKAVSVVRGQILGKPLTPHAARTYHGSQSGVLRRCEGWLEKFEHAGRRSAQSRCSAPFTVTTVPASFATLPYSKTCNGLPQTPDTCPSHLSGSTRAVRAITYVGRYPPLYYAVVGLPSLVSQSDAAIYGMRFVSGLLTAVFIGLSIGLVVTWSSRRLLLLAVVTAFTPMLLVFGSAVNPSGLEMASALCVWTGLLILVLERAEKPPPSLVAATTAASAALILSRALSPLWLLVMVLFVCALRPSAIRSLAYDRGMRIGSSVLALATLVALAYDLWARPFDVLPVGSAVPPGASIVTLVEFAIADTGNWMYQFCGAFGWALSNPPLGGLVLLGLVLGVIVFGVFLTSDRRHLTVFLLLIVTALLLPVAIIASQATKDGIVWQARDGFPLYCGVILVAGAITPWQTWKPTQPKFRTILEAVMRRFVLAVAVCVALAQLFDLYWALRRYTVGFWGPLNLWANVPGKFTPPLSINLLLPAVLALCVIYGWWIVHLSHQIPMSTTSPRRDMPIHRSQ
jgi:Predicted membrane protein (DUF2142)